MTLVPYDERLAERVRTALANRRGVAERRMFGGISFLLQGNMCCGIVRDLLVLRLGSQKVESALSRPHTREMDFTGRPMKGMLYVEPSGTRTEAGLRRWVEEAVEFVQTLPAKHASPRRKSASKKSKTR